MWMKTRCAALLALPITASAQSVDLAYEVTDLGGGLYHYDFEMSTDAGWRSGMGWRWVVFGDCAGPCSSPLTDFAGAYSSLPAGPWTWFSITAGEHNGTSLSPVLEFWIPADGAETVTWSGTSTANLARGDLLFSTLDGTLGGAIAANFKVAIRINGGGCYADCDGSGQLDFFDFLCFQSEFSAGSSYADCDQSGALDFFDFLCFQSEFSAGCP